MTKKTLSNNLVKHLPKELSSPIKQKTDVSDDYEYSRETYKELINTGMGSLDTLAEVARQTEHPRAYEVLSKAIKDIADTTDKLMALQKNKKELEKDDRINGTGVNTTNNNLFVGSTTELQRLLRDANKNEEKAIIDVDAKVK